MMIFNVVDDKVHYFMRAGADVVEGYMSPEDAQSICDKGVVTSNKTTPHHEICVDDRYFFAGKVGKKPCKK